jgi:hypothetical protein
MQKDFHHAVTYVAARFAGFGHAQADTVAYAAQYVDDATNTGTVVFDNNAMYTRICSAHKMVDPRNLDEVQNHRVWLPFHFLPGNGGLDAAGSPDGGFIEKIICRPDSPVAREMLQTCLDDRKAPYSLHRLGITMHVYADTWAHQGFAGVNNVVNAISALDDEDKPLLSGWSRFKEKSKDLWARVLNGFTKIFPLGHSAALCYPDMPFLTWQYKDHTNKTVIRNNTEDFVAAANAMCRAMQRYRDVAETGIPEPEQAKIRNLFLALEDEDGDKRHARWLEEIAKGLFSIGTDVPAYQAKGKGSWKERTLGTTKEEDDPKERFPYNAAFLSSDWKNFHDALQAHRFSVINDILPKYGICAG